MPDIRVCGISAETAEALKHIAKERGISVAGLVRKAIEEIVAREQRRAAVDRIDALGAEIAKIWHGPTSLEMIRKDRDRR